MASSYPNNEARVMAYLLDGMSPQERDAFDQDKAQNPELAQEFEFQQALMMRLVLDEKKNQREEFPESPSPKVRRLFRGNRPWLLAAAVVAIMLLVSLASYLSDKPRFGSEELYAQHIDFDFSDNEAIGRGASPTKEDLVSARRALKNQDWERLINIFSAYEETDTLYTTGLMYQVIAHLGTGRTAEAQRELDELTRMVEQQQPAALAYQDQILWYQALAALQAGEREEAKVYLEQFLALGIGNQPKAQELLKQLNETVLF